MEKMKQLLFSVTKSDCRWDYYKGSGKGGQKRNKTENCVRCTHIESGAVGKSEEGRSKEQNKKRAFERMTATKEFKTWLKLESARRTGLLAQIEEEVDRQMNNIKVEYKNEDGKWVKNEKLD